MNGCEHISEPLFFFFSLTGWTLVGRNASQARATFHHESIVKRNPLATTHAHTCSAHSGRMLVLFLPRSMGETTDLCLFHSLHDSPAVRGAVTPASDFFFPVVWGNNGTRGANAPQWLGVLFLATVRAAQDISQSSGRLVKLRAPNYSGGDFFLQFKRHSI